MKLLKGLLFSYGPNPRPAALPLFSVLLRILDPEVHWKGDKDIWQLSTSEEHRGCKHVNVLPHGSLLLGTTELVYQFCVDAVAGFTRCGRP